MTDLVSPIKPQASRLGFGSKQYEGIPAQRSASGEHGGVTGKWGALVDVDIQVFGISSKELNATHTKL